MRRRFFLHLALGSGAATATDATPPLAWRERRLLGFGTTLALQAGHADAAVAERALDDAVHQLRRIEGQMSLFDAASALARLNRDGRLDDPPAELLELLATAQQVAEASGGAFDVTVQPLWTCWDSAARAGRRPDAAEIAAARALVGWRDLELTPRRVRLRRAGMAVTLNGIAQGYAADRVRAVLAAHGIGDALVDAGEFAMLGRNRARRPWALGVADPLHAPALLARLVTDGRCVATSADNETVFSADHRHHHIVDPHTGLSPPELAGVTVAARCGALADALTKVMFVAGPGRIPALAARWGVDVLWVDKQGRWQATAGLALA